MDTQPDTFSTMAYSVEVDPGVLVQRIGARMRNDASQKTPAAVEVLGVAGRNSRSSSPGSQDSSAPRRVPMSNLGGPETHLEIFAIALHQRGVFPIRATPGSQAP